MSDWFAGLGGSQLASALMWAVAALILLTIVLVVMRLVRNMNSGTFVAGGRNRKTRLAVMDATAVDSHRRLVLVRRDDVEHLLLIGGPTDVVVEQDIRGTPARRTQSVFGDDTDFETQAQPLPPLPVTPHAAVPRQRAADPAPPPPPRPIQHQPAPPQPARQAERAPPPTRPQPDRNNGQTARPSRQTNARPPAPAYEPPPAYVPPPAASRTPPTRLPPASLPPAPARTSTGYAPPPSNNLDDALMRELEVTFEAPPPKSAPKPVEMTLDDEMTKLLGELSNNNR